MSDSPELVIRRFLTALEAPDEVDEIVSFFADDGEYLDPIRGVHRGLDAIRSEFRAQAAMGFANVVATHVKFIVADGGIVMMERCDSWTIGSKSFSMDVLAAFVLDDDGRIKRWRDSYDTKLITEQVESAGFHVPS